ncbi:hypothetical protein BJ508DRAFT_328071 [Ascobolus immersus RN42]|uniref:Uncharacterized protein n=1 Tax=Ascobolus immersus RN42 TaxID=1160509 RepID=A0A3N4I4L7_ASCIM|nr:hypothetical protein BJ508DRAFT_328071 [Ascobolus immersus RN42]
MDIRLRTLARYGGRKVMDFKATGGMLMGQDVDGPGGKPDGWDKALGVGPTYGSYPWFDRKKLAIRNCDLTSKAAISTTSRAPNDILPATSAPFYRLFECSGFRRNPRTGGASSNVGRYLSDKAPDEQASRIYRERYRSTPNPPPVFAPFGLCEIALRTRRASFISAQRAVVEDIGGVGSGRGGLPKLHGGAAPREVIPRSWREWRYG